MRITYKKIILTNPINKDNYLWDLQKQIHNIVNKVNTYSLLVTKQTLDKFENSVEKLYLKLSDDYYFTLSNDYQDVTYQARDFLEDMEYLRKIVSNTVERLYKQTA